MLSLVGTLVRGVAVAVPGCAHGVVFSLVFAGASLAPEQTAGLVHDTREGLQGLEGSIHCVCHVGTEVRRGAKQYI